MTARNCALLWLRQDLRLADHPALRAALCQHAPIYPVYIWSPEEEGRWAPGSASRWWLHQSLSRLDAALRERGSRLIIRRGPTVSALRDLISDIGATAVYWQRRYEPAALEQERAVQTALMKQAVSAEPRNGSLLFDPGTIHTKKGTPFQVFTAFWKACLKQPGPRAPEEAPTNIPAPRRWPKSLKLAELELEPKIDWAGGIRDEWQPGEAGAMAQLKRFLQEAFDNYPTGRDRPDQRGTSRLSPHLHFGEISIRQVWAAVQKQRGTDRKHADTLARYRAELGWREFAHHLLFHFPQTPEQPLRPEFARFPWVANRPHLAAWQRGQTGYPIVDAGMRELWHTGWMHNRVRMIVASFLVKDLLMSWQEGAEWFWDTLVDADLANNTLGWQWTAGCGSDAAPYFRVFNPVLQGEKFDPKGEYVRRWVPELAQLPNQWVHKPWQAPEKALRRAGVQLGKTYPPPLVDHETARKQALAALAEIRK